MSSLIIKEREGFKTLVNKAIRVEKQVGKLYLKFYAIFPEDREFWIGLAKEEMNHAALIKSIKDLPQSLVENFIQAPLVDLEESNDLLDMLLDQYSKMPPSREDAFNVALLLEGTVGELNYQSIVSIKESNSKIYEVFQELNGDDVDHEERIKSYMRKHDIQIRIG